MYLPAHFAERDPERLRAFLASYPFGVLVGAGDPPEIAHVPFVSSPEGGALWGHVARANPVWRGFDGRAVTVVFQGPHGYVSPRFYASKQLVPTWNYAAVHVRGAPRLLERDDEVDALLRRLGEVNEAGSPSPWSPDELDPAAYANLRRAIVAFEVPLTELVGKFKLGQNRAPADREALTRALEARGGPDDLAMLRWGR
ncbi:MAG TPA: FMN-binding negative transcriptional regulator [Polyangiaceae bacterium]|nr:FMN-binding negative transcriptional regulator [Polyangiaceae bacterium]